MGFPKKFRSRLNIDKSDVILPNQAWITYAVCGCETDSCGWEGWILESAKVGRGQRKRELSIDTSQRCPRCGKILFRTEVSIRFAVSKNQKPDLVPNVDFIKGKMHFK